VATRSAQQWVHSDAYRVTFTYRLHQISQLCEPKPTKLNHTAYDTNCRGLTEWGYDSSVVTCIVWCLEQLPGFLRSLS